MKVVSFSFKKGGAGIAAKNFSDMLPEILPNENISLISQDNYKGFHLLLRVISLFLSKLQLTNNPIKHSLNLFTFGPLKKILGQSTNERFHFHWFNNDTLSIFDLKRIPKNSIITLHDEWLYCGAEHCYEVDSKELDFINGYKNKILSSKGINWNYIIWKIKYNNLKNRVDITYTVPSTWMMERAKKSLMLRDKNIILLPNPINTEVFKPISLEDRKTFRQKIGLNDNHKIFLFGAIEISKNYLKGVHFILEAITILSQKLNEEEKIKIKFVSFGNKQRSVNWVNGVEVINLGYVETKNELANLYSSADCMIITSLVESFGQTAAESLACATPVLSFGGTGLDDILISQNNSLICKNKKSQDLVSLIIDFLALDKDILNKLKENARHHIEQKFSISKVREHYSNILKTRF